MLDGLQSTSTYDVWWSPKYKYIRSLMVSKVQVHTMSDGLHSTSTYDVWWSPKYKYIRCLMVFTVEVHTIIYGVESTSTYDDGWSPKCIRWFMVLKVLTLKNRLCTRMLAGKENLNRKLYFIFFQGPLLCTYKINFNKKHLLIHIFKYIIDGTVNL